MLGNPAGTQRPGGARGQPVDMVLMNTEHHTGKNDSLFHSLVFLRQEGLRVEPGIWNSLRGWAPGMGWQRWAMTLFLFLR